MLTFRNRVTTEFKRVDDGSDEHTELLAARHPKDGRPIWEQTGEHDRAETEQRIEDGTLDPTDLGDDDQPYRTTLSAREGFDASGLGPVPRGRPTPAELATDAGKASDDYEDPDDKYSTTTLSDVEGDGEADPVIGGGKPQTWPGKKSTTKGSSKKKSSKSDKSDGDKAPAA